MQNNIFFVQSTYHIKKLNMSMSSEFAYTCNIGTNTKGPPNNNIVHKYQIAICKM